MALGQLEERAIDLAGQMPDSVRRRVEGMDRRDSLIVLASEAPLLYNELGGIGGGVTGLPTTIDDLDRLLAMPEQQGAGTYDRREFLKLGGAAVLVATLLPSCALQLNNPGINMNINYDLIRPTVDIGAHLQKPATNILNRKTPEVLKVDGKRLDFNQHLKKEHPLTGESGIDGAPHPGEVDTYVRPVAAGVIAGKWSKEKQPIAGNRMVIFHGNGYVSWYSHLEEMYGDSGRYVDRFTTIGKMGATGAGAIFRGSPVKHTHSTFRGSACDPFLKGTSTQYHKYHEFGVTVSPYVKDHEDFSLLGKGKELAYPITSDHQVDEEFFASTSNARSKVNEYLRIFPHNNSIHPQEVLNVQRKLGIDLTLDRDMFYVYYSVLTRSLRDGSRELYAIKTDIEKLMLIAPRLTAFIKEPKV